MVSSESALYCDYNATAPLAERVKAYLREGRCCFLNPASLHLEGRYARKMINQVQKYLFKTFGLSKNEFEICLHSGATEGINWIFQGGLRSSDPTARPRGFFYSPIDHACVRNLAPLLEKRNIQCFQLAVDHHGMIDYQKTLTLMNESKVDLNQSWLNWTWSNNEIGVVWPLSLAEQLKKESSIQIHVDAVQAPGKWEQCFELSSKLDAYSFSGHKFGALKGIGHTFFRKGLEIAPLFAGGSQQGGNRPGTENPLASLTLQLALEELQECWVPQNSRKLKQEIEKELLDFFGDQVVLVGGGAPFRNTNTICLALRDLRADFIFPALDLDGIFVGTGSACSSGTIQKSPVLDHLGLEEYAGQIIRLSFSPYLREEEAEQFVRRFKKVLSP